MVADVPTFVNETKQPNLLVPLTEPLAARASERLSMPLINYDTRIELPFDDVDWPNRDSRSPSFIEHSIDGAYDSDGWDPTAPELYDSHQSSPFDPIEELSELSPPRLRRENALPRCDNLSVADNQFVDNVLNMHMEYPHPQSSQRAQNLAALLEAGAVSDLLDDGSATAGSAPTIQPSMNNLLNQILQDAAMIIPLPIPQLRESRRDNIICAPEIDPHDIPQHIIDITTRPQSGLFDFSQRPSGHVPESSGHAPESSGHAPESSGHAPESSGHVPTDAAIEHIAKIMGIADAA